MKNMFYKPLTATPFKRDEKYKEVQPQNQELAKYIRCFWGSEKPYLKKEKSAVVSLVVPDTCVDIIYRIDYTENRITGVFCGINDSSFCDRDDTECGHMISIFAIRFYAWGAYAFSEDFMKDTINGFYDVQSRFCWLDKMLRQQLLEKHSLEERSRIAEEILLQRMFKIRQHPIVDHAVKQMIMFKGTQSAAGLAEECVVSSRHLERLFHEYIGITPKKLCNLVRYQCLWNEIVINPGFQVLDAVYEYGYADQSHLMREFKRYHTMDIQKAKMYAYHNVGNIQYFLDR